MDSLHLFIFPVLMALTVPCRGYPIIHLYLSFLFETQTDIFLLPIRNLISTFILNKEELLISCPETSPADPKINSGFPEWNSRLTFKPFLPSSSSVHELTGCLDFTMSLKSAVSFLSPMPKLAQVFTAF